ncbi:MAG TPA: hypothetical protein VGL27_13525 [Negativicutes bacterium]
MSQPAEPVVNHITRIILKLVDKPLPYGILQQAKLLNVNSVRSFGSLLVQRTERVAEMMEALEDIGFAFTAKKDCIYADSGKVGAWEAKQYLLDHGFQDREFQVQLEYTRKWGMM